jgi:hypothetical protein
MTAELQLLEAIMAQVMSLHAKIDAQSKRDAGIDAGALVVAIAECAGDHVFTTRELVHHADYAEPLRQLINGRSPKALGRIFRQIENHDFDGLTIRAIGPSRDGVLWRVFGANTLTL